MLEMRGIRKSYGAVRANRGIDLVVPPRRIVGLLGENGSGKTTLVNILFGVVRPDSGTIAFKGRALAGHTPREALAAGIGMIHQHFTLVPAMTVTENAMLGWSEAGRWLRARDVAARVSAASRAYGLGIDPDARVGDLPLGLRQRVEILKAILHGAELLVLDEPSSNLSPPEVAALLEILRRLRAEGRSVVFISHKLGEVLEVCDEVVVLRHGEVAGGGSTEGLRRDDLARMMVGRALAAPPPRPPHAPGDEVLVVADLAGADAAGVARLAGVSFSVRAGEVLAIAGVDGNGQSELADIVGGLAAPTRGRVYLDGADVTRGGVPARLRGGLAHIPADRGRTGLVKDMTVADNVALRDFDREPFVRGPWLDPAAIRDVAARRAVDFAVRADSVDVPVRTLSGGNQQKVVLARELGRAPRALLAEQPTRGLDPGATRFVMEQVEALRAAGAAVLYISTELEEVLAIGDRIGVMHGGRLAGVMRREEVDLTRIGLMMAGALAEPPDADVLYGVSPRGATP